MEKKAIKFEQIKQLEESTQLYDTKTKKWYQLAGVYHVTIQLGKIVDFEVVELFRPNEVKQFVKEKIDTVHGYIKWDNNRFYLEEV